MIRQAHLLSCSPEEALQKMATCFGRIPSPSGHNIPELVALRDELFALDVSERYAGALMIVAPHTHWNTTAPIIIEQVGPHYVVGPKYALPGHAYQPVSFSLAAEGLIPYEWAAESVGLDGRDVNECIGVMHYLWERSIIREGVLGLSINFRFKKIFDQEPIPNIENPLDTPPPGYLDASRIDRLEGAEASATRDAQQVSWHLFSDKRYGLSSSETVILAHVRALQGLRRRPSRSTT